MADGARRLLGCDISLSATGVAGPGKDEWDHEVGTAFVAISTAEGAHVRALNLGSRPVRARLRTQTAHHAFDLARRYLSGPALRGLIPGPPIKHRAPEENVFRGAGLLFRWIFRRTTGAGAPSAP